MPGCARLSIQDRYEDLQCLKSDSKQAAVTNWRAKVVSDCKRGRQGPTERQQRQGEGRRAGAKRQPDAELRRCSLRQSIPSNFGNEARRPVHAARKARFKAGEDYSP